MCGLEKDTDVSFGVIEKAYESDSERSE